MDTKQTKVHEARRYFMETNKPVTTDAVRNVLLRREEKPIMVLEVFQQHNKQMENLVGLGYAPSILERYTISLAHPKAFIQWKYKVSDLDIKRLDFQFLTRYELKIVTSSILVNIYLAISL